MPRFANLASLVLLTCAAPLAAKDSLGVFADWGAFRDPQVPRCYAIAAAQESRNQRQFDPFASVGTWPDRQVRGQVHFRLSRDVREDGRISLVIGGRSFALTGSGPNAWAGDRQMDAQILAEMRSGASMSVSATDARGRRFTDHYSLDGAATALDAASVGCSGR